MSARRSAMHCPVCYDRGIVSVDAADAWRQEMRGNMEPIE